MPAEGRLDRGVASGNDAVALFGSIGVRWRRTLSTPLCGRSEGIVPGQSVSERLLSSPRLIANHGRVIMTTERGGADSEQRWLLER
jgi:hypothetical protein